MKVEIFSYSRELDREQLTGVWTLDSLGKAVSDSPTDQAIKELHGVRVGPKVYYPKDGEMFLRHLPKWYQNSTMVSAVFSE